MTRKRKVSEKDSLSPGKEKGAPSMMPGDKAQAFVNQDCHSPDFDFSSSESDVLFQDQDRPSNGIVSSGPDPDSRFIGAALPDEEARQQWPHRYQRKNRKRVGSKSLTLNADDEEILQACHHYTQAEVDGRVVFSLHDNAYVKAGDGEDNHICRIIEIFETVDGQKYFTAQWFYRARDTVIKSHADLIDVKRVFLSEIKDDNSLDCLIEKLKIVKVPLDVDLSDKVIATSDYDFYYDMKYLLPYSTFINLPIDDTSASGDNESTISSDVDSEAIVRIKCDLEEVQDTHELHKSEMVLLDLYSGCGAMSTGLCLGANMSGLNLVTRWAVDINAHACESIRLNHPETQVRNEPAEDFLALLEEWEKLCITFSLIKGTHLQGSYGWLLGGEDETSEEDNEDEAENDSEVFEVQRILAICYGDPKENKARGLYLKVRWKGYGPSEDSWEPIENLGNCQEGIKEFVTKGYESKIIPLPGDVDIICGGPPCQGISGYNRFRNTQNPLEDEKNRQLVVFMDFVVFLKPKYVLMENVVDILKFSEGYLGRYALVRLIKMNYQARMGIMAAGAYGLPQFRLRVFLWGARPTESLPPYPLPTYDVVLRGGLPREFQISTVAHDEGHNIELNRKLLLEDAISDLPPVTNNENCDEMPYGKAPQTRFQQFIRLRKGELSGSSTFEAKPLCNALYDHQPLKLNDDDYQRVCQIPKKKGANFRDLPGVLVGDDNRVKWDPNVKRVLLPSGKPLVPDYAMTFVDGRSSKPFGRLWWDETVPTVVTRAEPHNQIILHPEQDRVLSVRENARLQGFPDYYKLCGPIKERYIQVGNAVAIPVARALGYALGRSCQGFVDNGPLLALPLNFPNINKGT